MRSLRARVHYQLFASTGADGKPTVGYGDVSPITPLGKVLAAVVALGGIGLAAMPTSNIAAAFSDAMQRHHGQLAARRSSGPHD